jgi:hypothetical protein
MSARVTREFIRLFIDLFSIFEPIAPPIVSLYLGRRLHRWKNAGLISDYKSTIQRKHRLHYVLTVDFDLTEKQADRLMTHVERQAFRRR